MKFSDVRASEDQGTDPSITDQTFDTKLPLNINDNDFFPGMEKPPVVREGFTEMTFVLIRYEIGYTIRRLSYLGPASRFCPKAPEGFGSIEGKESKIRELRDYLENKYLKYCDVNVPIQWVTFHVAKLVRLLITTTTDQEIIDFAVDYGEDVADGSSSSETCRWWRWDPTGDQGSPLHHIHRYYQPLTITRALPGDHQMGLVVSDIHPMACGCVSSLAAL